LLGRQAARDHRARSPLACSRWRAQRSTGLPARSRHANNHRGEYEAVFARTYNQNISFVDAERAAFGFHHGELGGEVARLWQLSPLLEVAIRHHHSIDGLAGLPDATRHLVALVSVASASLSKLGVGRKGAAEDIDPTSLAAWETLGLSLDDMPDVVTLCAEEAERARALVE